jgi:hypothetical protein
MSQSTLIEIEALTAQLSFEERLILLEHLAQRVRMDAPGRPSQDLYGIWKDKVPADVDLDKVLSDVRSQWTNEWSGGGEFVG